ncbi:MAG: phosphate transport system regulatory protein PhoU [Bacteroidetes bacterium]|nr:phosphate transport system regulatory protein PhoU [Bacteroidota bacterium]
MTHLETELQQIKDSIIEMMTIVKAQLSKGKEALIGLNKELALEVMHNEKRVNGYDIMIDNSCENVIARFNPVAIDLRFLLATLKMQSYQDENTDLARKVFEKDKHIDTICNQALTVIAEYLKKNQENTEQDLYLLLIHRKLERVGDLLKNIAEEIIFFLEAKVLKHKKQKD